MIASDLTGDLSGSLSYAESAEYRVHNVLADLTRVQLAQRAERGFEVESRGIERQTRIYRFERRLNARLRARRGGVLPRVQEHRLAVEVYPARVEQLGNQRVQLVKPVSGARRYAYTVVEYA